MVSAFSWFMRKFPDLNPSENRGGISYASYEEDAALIP